MGQHNLVSKVCLIQIIFNVSQHESRNLALTSEREWVVCCGERGEVKVQCTVVQSLGPCTGRTAHRGSRGIALLFLDHGTRSGEGSVSRPGRSLPPEKTRYPLYRRLGGLQGRSGQVRKISHHRDSIPGPSSP